jgi:hypothetical protein
MRSIKTVLLCGAALAGLTLQARAEDLSVLKAEIEALNARLAQIEAAPTLPANAALVTISQSAAPVVPGLEETDPSYGDVATVISVLPTADAPATTSITWTGFARSAAVFVNNETGDDDLDIKARGELKVVGVTETSVGEIGAQVKIRADFDGNGAVNVSGREAWGWWAMTPELTLGGGYSGSLGNIGYGYDGSCNCYYTDYADVSMDPGDTTQVRLTYASGPISVAVAVEDASTDSGSDYGDRLGTAGEVKYSSDTVSGEISAVWRDGDTDEDLYQVGAGLGLSLSTFATLNVGAAYGQNHDGEEYWVASALASANLSDAVHAEIAYGHRDNKDGDTVDAALAGIYYDPVSQLTIGLEGEWIDQTSTQVDIVTVFRF